MHPPPLPQQLLADSSWRLRNSLWVLPAFLGCGMFTWLSFGYIGFQARNRSWRLFAVVYAVAFAGLVVAMEVGGPSDDEVAAGVVRTATEETVRSWLSGAIVAVWIAGMVHVMLVRQQWLTWRAQHSAPWWAQQVATPIVPAYAPPVSYPAQPVSYPAQAVNFAAPPAPAPPVDVPAPPVDEVDVNTAGADELRSLGLSEDVAADLLERRRASGGFASVQDFAAAAGLKPHELALLLPRIRVPAAPTAVRFGSTARRLDL